MRKYIILIFLIIMTINLTACFDSNEIDDNIRVIAIGIDRGISDKWRLTLQFPIIKESSGGSGKGSSGGDQGKDSGSNKSVVDQGEYTYISIDSPSFFGGIDMLNTSVSRKINFKHMQLIVFSEEVAKEGLIGEFIAPLNRFTEIRKTSHIFVTKGKAIDFIKENKGNLGTSVAKDLKLIVGGSIYTGYFPIVTFEEFYQSLKSKRHQAIAPIVAVNKFDNFIEDGKAWGTEYKTGGEYTGGDLPRIGKSKIEIWGTGLFKGDNLIKEINGDETRYLLMLKGKFKQGAFTIEDPKKPELIVPLKVIATKKPEVKIKIKNSKPVIKIKIYLDGDLLAVQSMIDYEDPKLKKLLEDTFKEKLKIGMETLLNKCKELNMDVFNFGDSAAYNFLTINEWEKYDWNSHFKDAEITVEVDFIIRRTGKQVKSNNIAQ